MKIVFFGTPEFAVPSLEILYHNGYSIPAVVTAPGKQAGRGLQIKQSPVKDFADSLGLKTLQPARLSDPAFIEELQNLHADLFVVVAFRMLPEAVWKMPPLGTFNLHSSLLPQYRGAAPIQRAIINGETETGVTTFFLKHEIDTGNIIFNEKTTIGPGETAGELHDRLKHSGANLVLKTVKAIESGSVNEIPQNSLYGGDAELKLAPKIFPADCKINWSKTAQEIHNLVRGLNPVPGAFTILYDSKNRPLKLKIFRTELTSFIRSNPTGSIISDSGKLFISCSDYLLQILELQQEGKKRFASAEFLRGFRIENGWRAL